jgi:hypothetical protein
MKIGDFVMVEFSLKDISFGKIIEIDSLKIAENSRSTIRVELINDRLKRSDARYKVPPEYLTVLTDGEAMLKRLEYSE